eukprot:m.125624 g.125624  ORF g.125624 m.125624 type:complete len:1086 (+) comp15752_c0_seq1:186-3443(+)
MANNTAPSHLNLLREQHRKLQARCADLERQLSTTDAGSKHSRAAVLGLIETLFDSSRFSDLQVRIDSTTIQAHKLVFAARGRWSVSDLAQCSELVLSDISIGVGRALVRFLYTDTVDTSSGDVDTRLELLKAADQFQLPSLKTRCEEAIAGDIDGANCVKLLAVAHVVKADTLKTYAVEYIVGHWDDIAKEDFQQLEAPLLFEVVKRKSEHPLHLAIELQREDVVFLFLVEHDLDLNQHINLRDTQGRTPLLVALQQQHDSIAISLMQHGADINAQAMDESEQLLHACIASDNEHAALFLLKHGVDANAATRTLAQTPLHYAARRNAVPVAQALLASMQDINPADSNGDTPVHCAIRDKHAAMVELLLSNPKVDINRRNKEGHTTLWLALGFEDQGYAQQLVDRGCDVDLVSVTGDTMLHDAIRNKRLKAALFLISRGCNVTLSNHSQSTPLHEAATQGLLPVCQALLQSGAQPNSLDSKQCTPLMLAVANAQVEVVNRLLQIQGLSLNQANSDGETALALALQQPQPASNELVGMLIQAGADLEVKSPEGLSLLQTAVVNQDLESAQLLASKGADVHCISPKGDPIVALAVKHRVPKLISSLVRYGADVNAANQDGDPPLWLALGMQQFATAKLLVQAGCKTNFMFAETQLTLLQRAVLEGQLPLVKFLLQSGADVNLRNNPEQATALHIAAGLGEQASDIIRELVRAKADVNLQDVEGCSALHRAIYGKHSVVAMKLHEMPQVKLGLRDREDRTAFGAALHVKDQNVAAAILRKAPKAIEERDHQGMTYLHQAVAQSDSENVRFLLKLGVDVNARMLGSSKRTPLAIAVERQLDEEVKLLLAAGADHSIPDADTKWTVAHIAALIGCETIFKLLLQHQANMNAQDAEGNTVAHAALKAGYVGVVKTLAASNADFAAVNRDGQTPLHLLAANPQQGSLMVLQAVFPRLDNLNPQDSAGYTPLHVAFLHNASQICMGLVRNGGHLGIANAEGRCCFDDGANPKLSKLLMHLVQLIPAEPEWIELPFCQVCKSKFSTRTRKHHCRHCGRILCKKDSSLSCPIIKFQMDKPQRVCDFCHIVLSGGSS